MSGGTLKDVVKTLGGALSAPVLPYPLPEDVLSVIQSYINKQDPTDEHESQRLHEELLSLHDSKVQNSPEKHAFFLTCFRYLQPAIISVEKLLTWWELLLKPTLDSISQAQGVVDDARHIVLNVLVYDKDDDPTTERAKASSLFTDKLFGLYLEKTRLLTSDRGAGFSDEQTQRLVSVHVEAVLLAFGKRMPLAFLLQIDKIIVQKAYRLQILALLCGFVRLQGPHLYQILETPLLDHLLQCLENDTSTTVISLALTALVMFMPHLCNYLADYLPRLFVVYTRVICWDKFGGERWEETKFSGSRDSYSRAGTPQPLESLERVSKDGWQKLDSSFEAATSSTPEVSEYFSFLYGLYPINFVSFIREPYKFLERADYKGVDLLDIEEETIRQRSEPYRQLHTLHPNFLTLTAETELSDKSRWMKVEPADVTAQCVGLRSNNLPTDFGLPRRKPRESRNPAFVPTQEIPSDALLGMAEYENTGNGESNWRESAETILQVPPPGEVRGLFQPAISLLSTGSSPPLRDLRSPDSPTIPATLTPSECEEQLQDMLDLQEQVRASLLNTPDSPSGPPPSTLPPAPPPEYTEGVAASPRLDAYVQHLHNSSPRSPAIKAINANDQRPVSYLQRELMLVQNDLNFERYLKQQHLAHIGHLQRKHIKESTAEAETQNLINTNKTLKVKLEDAKKALATARQENLKRQNQSKKWEAELSAKIRTLREEQKAWRQDEEATKQALQTAHEEADHLRKLLSESEAGGLQSRQKLQSVAAETEEVDKMRSIVDHLSMKLTEFESRSDEFELQRHNEQTAISQVERMKIRLQSREQELQKQKRLYEARINDLNSRLNSASHPMPASPGPGFQGMIDSALQVANKRLAALRKAHGQLISKYTELEIRYIELQAAAEAEGVSIPQASMAPQPSQSSLREYGMHSSYGLSENEAGHQDIRRVPRRSQYQPSDDSMSPHSSYTESSNETYHGNQAYADSQFSNMVRNTTPSTGSASMRYAASQPYPSNLSMNSEVVRQEYMFTGPPPMSSQLLRHKASVPDTFRAESSASPSLGSDEVGSLKTTSTGSAERREKIKTQPEMRMRGRGGVQNVGKSAAEKEEKKRKKEEEKKNKKSKFTTGSGLAGIRGFVV